MSLLEALQDAHAEIAQGGPALTIIESVAADYGIHPALLARKFSESYGDPETLKERQDAAAQADTAFQARAEADWVQARAEADWVQARADVDQENQMFAEFLLTTKPGKAILSDILQSASARQALKTMMVR